MSLLLSLHQRIQEEHYHRRIISREPVSVTQNLVSPLSLYYLFTWLSKADTIFMLLFHKTMEETMEGSLLDVSLEKTTLFVVEDNETSERSWSWMVRESFSQDWEATVKWRMVFRETSFETSVVVSLEFLSLTPFYIHVFPLFHDDSWFSRIKASHDDDRGFGLSKLFLRVYWSDYCFVRFILWVLKSCLWIESFNSLSTESSSTPILREHSSFLTTLSMTIKEAANKHRKSGFRCELVFLLACILTSSLDSRSRVKCQENSIFLCLLQNPFMKRQEL